MFLNVKTSCIDFLQTYETSISREEPTELTMSSTVDKVDLSKDLVAGLKGGILFLVLHSFILNNVLLIVISDEIMENYENVSFSPPQGK